MATPGVTRVPDRSSILAWELVADAIADDACALEQLAWVDRMVSEWPEVLQDWIDYRQDSTQHDPKEIRRLITPATIRDARQSSVWEHLLTLGFQETWSVLKRRGSKLLNLHMATILHSPSLLSEFDALRNA